MNDRIPTLDFSSFFAGSAAARAATARRLGEVFETYGFVSLVGHGLKPALVEDGFRAAEHFFAQPDAAKHAVREQRTNRGFSPLYDVQKAGEKPSGHEFFSIGHPIPPQDPALSGLPFYAPTPWPALRGFRERVEGLYHAMFGLGETLLRAIALHLGVPETFFADLSRDTYSAMRLVHYPPHDAVAATSDLGGRAHVDRGLLTVLIQDMSGGLSVQSPEGDWLPVVPDPHAIVVNVGKLLRRWTNGRYQAALHRVKNDSGHERYSIPLFVHPSFHTRIDPQALMNQTPAGPEFEPIVAGEYTYEGFSRMHLSWKAAETANA